MKQIGRRNFFLLLGGLAVALLGAKTQAKATAPTGMPAKLKRFVPLKPVTDMQVQRQPLRPENPSKYPCSQDYQAMGEAGQPGVQAIWLGEKAARPTPDSHA